LLKNENIEKSLIKDKVGSHLMEKLIINSNDALFKQLYKDFFKSNMLDYTSHHVANFVVQKLILSCKKERYYKEILGMLKPKIADYLFRENRTGIVVALLESGVQYPSVQAELVSIILDVFGCTEKDTDIAKIILHLKSRIDFEKRIHVYSPNLQGSLLLQHLIQFIQPHCVPFITSVVSMNVHDILLWIQDPIAARVVENVITNDATPNKLKKQLIESFYGSFLKLSTDKYGSRFVDKCWQAANLEVKVKCL
jgi:nucleolar protein 9